MNDPEPLARESTREILRVQSLERNVLKVKGSSSAPATDVIAIEDPLEIRVVHGVERHGRSLAITMRTPGHDFELACGFLFTEGVIQSRAQILAYDYCGKPAPGQKHSNIVRVELAPTIELDKKHLERNFYTTSSCGICGKASLEALATVGTEIPKDAALRIEREKVHELAATVFASQDLFTATGGVHGAGLVDANLNVHVLREDVGRHNAVDKVIGSHLLAHGFDVEDRTRALEDKLLMVSGRTSFEIMQKALVAGIPMVVGVGPPSSLAIELAEEFGMSLVGFARDGRFNVYAGADRIVTRSREAKEFHA